MKAQVLNEYGDADQFDLTDVPTPDVGSGQVHIRVATNVLGAVSVIDTFLPLLRESQAGRIVNVSTTLGSLTDQSDSSSIYFGVVAPAYSSSKAALNGITVALAKLLKDTPIMVNSVCPGYAQTDLTPVNREQAPLTADEASQIVVELALIPDDGPRGQFIDRNGSVAW